MDPHLLVSLQQKQYTRPERINHNTRDMKFQLQLILECDDLSSYI